MSNSAYSSQKIFHHRKSLDLLKAGLQPAPIQVQLIISDLCNHDCPWCAYRMEGYSSNQLFNVIDKDGVKNHNPNRMIPYEKVLELLDDFEEMGVKAVQLTGGGEPTVHPHHVEIFKAIINRGLELALVTNGNIIRDNAIDPLMKATWIRVSVDAAKAETYGSTRRISPVAFERVQKNIHSLTKAKKSCGSNVTIGMGFVVSKENWREIYGAAVMAKELGVDNLRISALFQPDDEKYFQEFYDEARKMCERAKTLQNDRFRIYDNFGDRVDDLKQHNPDYSFCGYQHFCTYIGADQNVYRCCVYAYNSHGFVGSLQNQRFKDLWASLEKERNFLNFDARKCERCQFNEKNRTILYAIDKSPEHVNYV